MMTTTTNTLQAEKRQVILQPEKDISPNKVVTGKKIVN